MKLSVLKTLSFSQWRWLFSAYCRLWAVQLFIKYGSSTWLISKIKFSNLKDQDQKNNIDLNFNSELREAVKMYESVRLAARCHFWDTDCLPRSIVLADMLNKVSDKTAVVFLGVNMRSEDGKSLASHAWVELNGEIVGEHQEIAEIFKKLKQIS